MTNLFSKAKIGKQAICERNMQCKDETLSYPYHNNINTNITKGRSLALLATKGNCHQNKTHNSKKHLDGNQVYECKLCVSQLKSSVI